MKKIIFAIVFFSSLVFGQSFKTDFYSDTNVSGGAKENGEYNFVEYSIKSENEKLLYQIVDKVDYDIPFSKLEVFNNGNSVLISSFYGRLTFINNNGTKVKSLKIKESLNVEYERNILSVNDGSTLVILWNELNNNFSTIQRYDNRGTLIAEGKVPIININGIAFSEKLNRVFISHFQWNNAGEATKKVTLLDSNGDVINSFAATFEKGFFAEKNQFIGYSNKSIISIDAENKVLFNKQMDENQILLDVAYLKNRIYLATSSSPKFQKGKWEYNDSIILKLNLAGELLSKTNTKTALFNNFKFNTTENSVEFVAGNQSIKVFRQ